MGFIRGGLLVIASIILFLLFIVGNILLTLSLSLQYENVQPQIITIAQDLAEEQIGLIAEFEEEFEFMNDYCQNGTEFVFNLEGYTFEIPCLEISQGLESVIEYGVASFVEKVYYQEYDCEFLNCFQETGLPLFLISEKAQDFWANKFWISLGIAVILILIMLLLVENKFNLPIIIGALLTISALLFNKLDNLFVSLTSSDYLDFIGIFFSEASTVFWLSLIIGLVILIFGVVARLLKYGITGGKKITKKEAKEIVKKEVEKTKEVKKKK